MAERLSKLMLLPQRRNACRKEAAVKLPRIARTPDGDEIAAMAAAYTSGMTLREVGAMFDFDRGTVSAAVKRAGVATRDHQRVEVDLERASQLHRSGLTLTEVARTLGVGRTTLVRARRLNRAHVEPVQDGSKAARTNNPRHT